MRTDQQPVPLMHCHEHGIWTLAEVAGLYRRLTDAVANPPLDR